MAQAKRRLAVVISCVACAVATTFIIGLSCMRGPPSPRTALPKTAHDIHEYRPDISPDMLYLLRATISQKDFDLFVSRLKLEPHTESRPYTDATHWLEWSGWGSETPDWWDPSRDTEKTYVSQVGRTWTMAKHENGFVYYKKISH